MLDPFEVGRTIARSDVWYGRTWTFGPGRVIQDDGTTLVSAMWPGAECLAPSTWVQWLHTRDEVTREEALPRLQRGDWETVRWIWKENVYLHSVKNERWFEVTAVFRFADNTFLGWRIDFGRPPRRPSWGVETRDLFIDLIVHPDHSFEWKDEEEYDKARALGLVTEDEHERTTDSKDEALALISDRGDLFDNRWTHWSVDESWPIPKIDLP